VPTITLEGDANDAPHPDPGSYAGKFSGPNSHQTITGGIGHNLPQDAPEASAQAVIDVNTREGALMSEATFNAPLTVVLVHGAFADSSSWGGVIEILQAAGAR
jgi:pimeloyl-ACP methyl ester carboxylesterase